MLGTTVWATSQQPVDNYGLCTATRTTQLQDVFATPQACVDRFHMSFGVRGAHPQSTALITVIKSLYIHPQTTLKAHMPGVTS